MRLEPMLVLALSISFWACEDSAQPRIGPSHVEARVEASDPGITALLPLERVSAETPNSGCPSSGRSIRVITWSAYDDSGRTNILTSWTSDGELRLVHAGYGTRNWTITYTAASGGTVLKKTRERAGIRTSVRLPEGGAEFQHLVKLAERARALSCQETTR